MREYGKVHTAFWTSEDVRLMSDDGKMLALYLLTCPHGNMLGCFRLPSAYVAEDMLWEIGRVSKALQELFANGFIYRCDKSSWLLLNQFLKWNQFENPNVGTAAGKLFESLNMPGTVRAALVRALREHAPRFPKRILDEYETQPEPLPNPSELISKTGTGTGAVTGAEPQPSEAGASGASLPENPQPEQLEVFPAETPQAGEGGQLVPEDRRGDARNPDDVKTQTWRRAKDLCVAAGIPEAKARSAIGLMVKDYTVEVVLEAVRRAEHHKPVAPLAWLIGTCKTITGERRPLSKQDQVYAANQAVVDRILAKDAAEAGSK